MFNEIGNTVQILILQFTSVTINITTSTGLYSTRLS